ncbi:MAG: type III-A CRISPR-associated protein Csm2, partial [Dissulfuribacterales bacterium]
MAQVYGPQSQHQDSKQGKGGNRGGGGGHNDSLPTPTKVDYYSEIDKKTLNTELLDQKAIEWAKSFQNLRTSQMRRFYDDLKAIERKILVAGDIKAQEEAFKQNRALITMFKAKAA